MKFFKIIYQLAFIPILFTACDSDDDNTTSQEECVTCVEGVDTSIISEDFTFESRFTNVLGSQMHYIDEPANGNGQETFLLIHGNPTSVYLWRNIIPHLKNRGRVVAVDLIGMGQSDKPDIQYTLQDHIDHLDGFMDNLSLTNIIPVIHDAGSIVGFNYAANNQERIKGIVFFEALIKTFASLEEVGSFGQQLPLIRGGQLGDETPGSTWDVIVNQNIFIEGILPQSILRTLTPTEFDTYRAPFINPEDRLVLWQFPQAFPIAGEPAFEESIVANYSNFLQTSGIPKLMLFANPGLLISNLPGSDNQFRFASENIPNITIKNIGAGIHFLQEDEPHTIGIEINNWVDNNFN